MAASSPSGSAAAAGSLAGLAMAGACSTTSVRSVWETQAPKGRIPKIKQYFFNILSHPKYSAAHENMDGLGAASRPVWVRTSTMYHGTAIGVEIARGKIGPHCTKSFYAARPLRPFVIFLRARTSREVCDGRGKLRLSIDSCRRVRRLPQ
jgi:hypothetical protein